MNYKSYYISKKLRELPLAKRFLETDVYETPLLL